ncbi:DNA polymerase III subunit delta [Aestuariimicrobium ganziense]|uniref:DNA polymerase III subunit delta n=1 Tax=Aestuariimicrobium ganziense TaxID=2773677 RepID=UPI0019434C96|nr:DNA polymerase III subunit delta [Aestuariimicrobium ganziense]
MSPASPSRVGLGSALLVAGAESLFAERAVAHRLAQVLKQAPDVEVHQMQAAELTAGQFTELIGGSLFSSRSAVVLHDVSGLDQNLFDLVAGAAISPAEDVALILVHPGGVKGKGLLDRLAKGKVEKFDASPVKTWELGKFVADEASRQHVVLDERAGQALVNAIGSDVRALAAAVGQLGADQAGEPVTADVVARYFGGRAEVSSFAVADDVMGGHPAQALEKLRWALETGVSPVLVTSALAGSLRSLGKYLDLQSRRISDPDMARELGIPPWKVKDVKRLARTWTPQGVASAIAAVARADAAVKGAATDPDFALEQLLLAIDAARRGPRG